MDAGRTSSQMLPNNGACVIKLATKIDSLPVSLAVTRNI